MMIGDVVIWIYNGTCLDALFLMKGYVMPVTQGYGVRLSWLNLGSLYGKEQILDQC